MLKKLVVALSSAVVLITLPSNPAVAVPSADSMTSCVITDGTTTLANFPLNVNEGGDPSTATVTMVPTPGSGKWLFSDNGFVNKTTNEFVQMGAGTGQVDNAGYQPPGDPGYWVATQRYPNFPDYPASDWTYEFRWWAVQGSLGSFTPDGASPLCKIAITVTPLDSTPPVISGSADVAITAPAAAVETYSADESVTWAVTGGADLALFEIDSASGALAFKSASVPGTYAVIITATDGATNATTLTVTVTVGLDKLASTGSDVQKHAASLGFVAASALTLGSLMVLRRRRISANL